jgi:uncharacterized protein (UPF0264 family)
MSPTATRRRTDCQSVLPASERTSLLVTVRSPAEVEAALAGGAALIDVKEPSHGSLGRADDATLAAVLQAVAGRRPVSAALGELLQAPAPSAVTGLSYAKWGLAGCSSTGTTDWRQALRESAVRLAQADPGCRLVTAAYADWQRAGSPSPEVVCAAVEEEGWGVVLLDTWGKDGSTLLDWMPADAVARLCRRCRAGGVRIALAGSLDVPQITLLRQAEPDWFAVRGAACRGGRNGPLDETAVRRLVDLLAS